jgi:selenocysteine lyase/cysteine desulfurase
MKIRPEQHPQTALAPLRPIYLDCHATTPVDPRVAELMVQVMTTNYGNPHNRGNPFRQEAADIVQAARIEVGKLVNGASESVVFFRKLRQAAYSLSAWKYTSLLLARGH